MADRTQDLAAELEVTSKKKQAAPTAAPSIFDLQRSAGNAAIVSLLTEAPVQTKALQVGAVHDPAEAEADRIADQVLRQLEAGTIGRRGDDAIRRNMAPGQIYQATVEEEE